MPQYMLDTNISSYFINGKKPSIDRRMIALTREDVCISVITKGELLFGVETAHHREQLGAKVSGYLRHMPVVQLSDAIAAIYAEVRANLKVRGLPIGSNDMWIAAHAQHLGLTLVTNNVREFSRVPGLKIENWAEEA